uniref:Fungal lipase-type domain-containing protein n=1 Tax=Eutreptiella gymnastica TaxID=73025 RepID=A0A7S4CYC8_9EUGL
MTPWQTEPCPPTPTPEYLFVVSTQAPPPGPGAPPVHSQYFPPSYPSFRPHRDRSVICPVWENAPAESPKARWETSPVTPSNSPQHELHPLPPDRDSGNPHGVTPTERLTDTLMDEFVQRRYLPHGATPVIHRVLLGVTLLILAVAAMQLVILCITPSTHGFDLGTTINTNDVTASQIAQAVFVAIALLVCLWLCTRSLLAIFSVSVADPNAKVTLSKVFDIVCSGGSWILYWNILIMQRVLSILFNISTGWTAAMFGITLLLILLPLLNYVQQVAFSAKPTFSLLLSAPLIGLASLLLALYMTVAVTYMEYEGEKGAVTITIDVMLLLFLITLVWSWNRVVTPWLLNLKATHYKPEDIEGVKLTKATCEVLDEEEDARRKKAEKKAAKKKHPGKPLQPVQHVTDPKDVLRQSAKGNALEGIGFLDGLILQGTIYLILLLVGYFAVICTGDSCPDTTGRRFLVAGFIVIPCIVLLAAIVSIAASYQVSKSDMVYINRALALLCPGIYSFDFVALISQCAVHVYYVSMNEHPKLFEWAEKADLEILEVFEDEETSTEAFMAAHTAMVRAQPTRIIIISFAGTLSQKDACLDLKFWHKGWDVGFPPRWGNRPKVHTGLRDSVFRAVVRQQAWYDQLYITGHSLGGAVATLCATDLQQRGFVAPHVRLGLITFGAPRAGNQAFQHWHDGLVRFSFHFDNLGDPVPKTPCGDYWPPGHKISMPNDRILTSAQRFMNMLSASIFGVKPTQHMMSEYIRRLAVAQPISQLPQWVHYAVSGERYERPSMPMHAEDLAWRHRQAPHEDYKPHGM